MFVSIKSLHVSVFFYDHLQGVLRCALCRYYSSRWFAFFEFVLLQSMWPHVYVICVCLVICLWKKHIFCSKKIVRKWCRLWDGVKKKFFFQKIFPKMVPFMRWCGKSFFFQKIFPKMEPFMRWCKKHFLFKTFFP